MAVLRLDPLKLQGAPDYQAERFDIDRLLIEVIGPLGDRLERAFARAVARGNDHLGVGLELHDRVEHGKAFAGSVRIGRKTKIERHDRRFLRTQRGNRAGAVADDGHLEVGPGPFELGLQPGIVLDDQQPGFALAHLRYLPASLAARGQGLE
jgi:hypothetical protein